MHLLRRYSLLLAAFTITSVGTFIPVATAAQYNLTSMQKKLADLETPTGGRIGVSAINTTTNMRIQYRADERFPFCSTSKVMVVAAILKKSMADPALLQQKIRYTKNDVNLSGYATITKNHIVDGMTINELCAAAITYSDNTAMNLLLKQLGGPEVVTAFARSIGNNKFRLDRLEPKLNSAIPGDLRDTATPAAMENSLYQLALGDVLALPQRKQLQVWLQNNTTGDKKIRAGVPQGWLVGDKTGAGEYGTTNDIGIIWPPKYAPIVVAVYFTQNKKDAAHRDDIIASVTRIVIKALS